MAGLAFLASVVVWKIKKQDSENVLLWLLYEICDISAIFFMLSYATETFGDEGKVYLFAFAAYFLGIYTARLRQEGKKADEAENTVEA